MRKNAALQVFANRLTHTGLWCVVVALAIELAGADQIKPDIKVLSNGLVEQGTLGVARVLEFGLD